LFGVDVIATPSLGHNEVNARSDDLLALHTVERQLEHDLSGKAEAVLSLNPEPKILVSKSKFKNCSFVRCESPSSRFQERRQEMDETEKFLNKDSLRFGGITRQIRETSPGAGRDQMMEGFWSRVWKFGYYKAELALIRAVVGKFAGSLLYTMKNVWTRKD
jgi:hypothetical protein